MWPFTRRPSPPAALPEITWRPGDMAECIRDDWRHGPPKRPRVGARAMVERVLPGRSSAGEQGVGLQLFRFAGAWDAGAFRKLPPAELVELERVSVPAAVE